MLDKDKWEESREEAKDLAQDYLDKEKTRSECVKYFEGHFKISTSTANRWYNRIYNELVIPDIHNAIELKAYKDKVEEEINKCLIQLPTMTNPIEKIELISKITKAKKELKKL